MILEWVYAYPGTLEALIERQCDPDDIFSMSTAEALEHARRPIREVGANCLLTTHQIVEELACALRQTLERTG